MVSDQYLLLYKCDIPNGFNVRLISRRAISKTLHENFLLLSIRRHQDRYGSLGERIRSVERPALPLAVCAGREVGSLSIDDEIYIAVYGVSYDLNDITGA